MRFLTVLLLFGLLMQGFTASRLAAASAQASIDRIISNYERSLNSACKSLQSKIAGFARSHRSKAITRLRNRLKSAEGEDKLFLAYHILLHSPQDADALAVFERYDKTPPVDQSGAAQAGSPIPVPADKSLIPLTTGISHPPLAEARQFLVSNAKTWAKSERRHSTKALADLLELHKKKGNRSLVNPVLAIYFPYSPQVRKLYPAAAKADRAWLNPLDRYLLDNGLAGIDAATYKPKSGKNPKAISDHLVISNRASWQFPIPLRTVKLEVGGIVAGSGTLRVTNREGQGISMLLGSSLIKIMQGNQELAQAPVPADFKQRGLSLEFDIQGRQGLLIVDGQATAQFSIPKQYAYVQFQVEGNSLKCSSAVCRYVGDADWAKRGPQLAKADDGDSETGRPAVDTDTGKPGKPATPSWQKERDEQLKKTISFAFEETALNSVVADLVQLSGIALTLDSSADDLKDLPINLAGENMAFSDVLKWLKRTADLDYRATESGFELYWGA